MSASASPEALVKKFAANPSETTATALIDYFQSEMVADDDIGLLAGVLASSGQRLEFRGHVAADIASTGGPSSLSTLLGPLTLRKFGCLVPKLGVQGRPAGGIDVMAQIPMFRVDLNPNEVQAAIDCSGFAHFQAGEHFAPLDARLFELRQKLQGKNIPALVIASLLAKKIAVGVRFAGIDIRVSRFGNFGTTYSDARAWARRFVRVGSGLGVDVTCFLTDGTIPNQPYIGRGEALIALLSYLSNNVSDELFRSHAAVCERMARETIRRAPARTGDGELEMRALADAHLSAHGASIGALEEKVAQICADHRSSYNSPKDGYFKVDLERLRSLLVDAQIARADGNNRFPDPVGVILKARHGGAIKKGDVLATVRAPTNAFPKFSAALASALDVTVDAPPMTPQGLEIVANG